MKTFYFKKVGQMIIVAILCIVTAIPSVASANWRCPNCGSSNNPDSYGRCLSCNYQRDMAPVILTPANNSILSYQDIKITWYGTKGTQSYLLSILDTTSYTYLADNKILTSNTTSYTIPKNSLTQGHGYQLWISAIDTEQQYHTSSQINFYIESNSSAVPKLTGLSSYYTVAQNLKTTLSGTITCSTVLQNVTVVINNVANGTYFVSPQSNLYQLNNIVIDAKALALAAGTYDIGIWASTSNESVFLGSTQLIVSAASADALDQDFDSLSIIYYGADNANYVTGDITLTTSTKNKTYITWTSSSPNIVSTTGKVNRPAYGDQTVTLTAVLYNDSKIKTKKFNIVVKGLNLSENLAVSDFTSAYYISKGEQFSLKGKVTAGSKIDHVAVKIYRQELFTETLVDSKTVNVNASTYDLSNIKFNTSTNDFSYGWYSIKVLASASKSPTDEKLLAEGWMTLAYNFNEQLESIKNALKITFCKKDKSGSVTGNLTLPTWTKNSASISWSTSNAPVVSSDGTVTRPLKDTKVTLTATISFNGCTATKTFTITVKGLAAKNTITIKQCEVSVNNRQMICLTCTGIKSSIRKKVSYTTVQYYSTTTNELTYDITTSGAASTCQAFLTPGSYLVRIKYYDSKNNIIAAGETTIKQK